VRRFVVVAALLAGCASTPQPKPADTGEYLVPLLLADNTLDVIVAEREPGDVASVLLCIELETSVLCLVEERGAIQRLVYPLIERDAFFDPARPEEGT
jgi:hypothetical protein